MSQIKQIVIDDYKNLTKGMAPEPLEQKEVKVYVLGYEKRKDAEGNPTEVSVFNGIFEDWIKEEYYKIELVQDAGQKTVNFKEDEFKAYCMYCIKQRVDFVNRKKVDFKPKDKLNFPALISVICQNIGKVNDPKVGVNYVPVLDDEAEEFIAANMDAEKARKISKALEYISGYQYAEGYTMNDIGSVEFMTMQVAAGVIKSHRDDTHPVYALLADIVGLKVLDAAINPLHKYGESLYLKHNVLSRLTSV